jgi:hypothetical protein
MALFVVLCPLAAFGSVSQPAPPRSLAEQISLPADSMQYKDVALANLLCAEGRKRPSDR